MIPLALSSTPGLWQGLNSVFLAGMVVDNSLQAGQLNVLAGRRGATKLAAVLHCFTPALISEIVELGRSHDIWDNSMAPILLLLHITAVGLILMGLFHAVGKERRAVYIMCVLCLITVLVVYCLSIMFLLFYMLNIIMFKYFQYCHYV